MYHEALIPITDAVRWRAALSDIPHALAHKWEYVHALAHTSIPGETPRAFYLYRQESSTARRVCPLAVRHWRGHADVVTPYGNSGFVGVGQDDDFDEMWRRFAISQEWVCGYIGLNPILDQAAYKNADVASHNHVYALDLSVSETALAEGFSRNIHQRLRDWQRSGARLIADQDRLAEFFVAEYHSFMRWMGASDVYQFARETLIALWRIENVFLVGAVNSAGILQAVSAFGYTQYCGEYLFNISLPEGRQHSAALLRAGILRLRDIGVPVMNLGGGIVPGDGLDAFKHRFGGAVRPLRALRQVYLPEAFQACCQAAGIDHRVSGGYFPPYRAQAAQTGLAASARSNSL